MDKLNTPNLNNNIEHEDSLRQELLDLKKKLQLQVKKETLKENTKSSDFLKETLGQLAVLESELVSKPEKKEEQEYITEMKDKLSSLKQIHTNFNKSGGNLEQVYKQVADKKREELHQNVSTTVSQMGQERPRLQWLVKKALNQ
jgi:hypothetical protein